MTDAAQEQEVETVLINVLDDINSVKALPQDMADRFMKVGRDDTYRWLLDLRAQSTLLYVSMNRI